VQNWTTGEILQTTKKKITDVINQTYPVNIIDGDTDKPAAVEGKKVFITANTPATGEEFDEWTTNEDITISDVTQSGANFIMINEEVTVTATYRPQIFYSINVEGGTSVTSTAANGGIVTITANPPIPGKIFDRWTTTADMLFTDEYKSTTTFKMIAEEVTVTANYIDASPPFPVTVINGTTDTPDAVAGVYVTITANEPEEGKVFDKWTTDSSITFANSGASSTTFIMIAEAVTVTATYKDAPQSINNKSINNVIVYPNPFKNELTISDTNVYKVTLFNQLGQKVEEVILDGKRVISTQTVPVGVYLLVLENNNGDKTIQKVIKK
jgi:hypothetical protein